jgi:hypothetical protein
MATTNPTTTENRTAEVCALAWHLMDEGTVDGYEDALRQAERQLAELLQFAEAWDAGAQPQAVAPAQAEPLYVPSALEPHEQRAVDKAIFERARGIVPQLVGRFWFVPSRITGGTVYRVTLDSCTCEAFTHGRLCWHRALIGLERELAA